MIRSTLCKVGFHKFTRREIHVASPIVPGSTEADCFVIERCDCGVARVALGGRAAPTKFVVPERYQP